MGPLVLIVKIVNCQAFQQVFAFRYSPKIAIPNIRVVGPHFASNEETNGRPNANSLPILLRRKYGRVRQSFWREFARLTRVTIHAINPDCVELFQEILS